MTLIPNKSSETSLLKNVENAEFQYFLGGLNLVWIVRAKTAWKVLEKIPPKNNSGRGAIKKGVGGRVAEPIGLCLEVSNVGSSLNRSQAIQAKTLGGYFSKEYR